MSLMRGWKRRKIWRNGKYELIPAKFADGDGWCIRYCDPITVLVGKTKRECVEGLRIHRGEV